VADRLEALWRQSVKDVTEQRPGAVTAAVRVSWAAIALDGLADQVRVDVTVSTTFERLTAELASNNLLPSQG
jgi:hypothetical protein